MGFEDIVKNVIRFLPDGAAKMIFGYLEKIGTTLTEILGWSKTPPTLDRKKDLVKKVLMSVQHYVSNSLQFLEQTKGENTGIFIRLVDTPNGQRPYVHLVTINDDGTLANHEQFFFHETGSFVIDTMAKLDETKKQLELAASQPPSDSPPDKTTKPEATDAASASSLAEKPEDETTAEKPDEIKDSDGPGPAQSAIDNPQSEIKSAFPAE